MDTTSENFKKLYRMIRDIKFTMLTTVSSDGSIHSRPMLPQDFNKVEFDGTLWFFSQKNSSKNHAIENDQHVNLTFTNQENKNYVSISGRATISEDKDLMKRLWNPVLSNWFSQGLDDPSLSLIGVNVDTAEVWDSPSGEMIQLTGLGEPSMPIPGKKPGEASINQ